MFGKYANSRSIEHAGDQLKTTVYRTDTAHTTHHLSHNDLFQVQDKFITMNDDRKKIERNYSRDFKRSDQESQLFSNHVRKIEIQHEQKQDRSLSRKYKNESQLKNLEAGLGTIVPIVLSQKGVKRINKSPPKTDRPASKKHFIIDKKQPESEVFLVSRIDLSSQHTSKSNPKIQIVIGKRKPNSTAEENAPKPEQPILSQRRHYENVANKKSVVGTIFGKENHELNHNSSINFKIDYYRKHQRLPEEKDKVISRLPKSQSGILHSSRPTDRLMKRFRNQHF